MAKLLDAINELSVENLDRLIDIQSALELRMDWLNDREPESCGSAYDTWEEKVDDLQEIIDNVGELDEAEDNKKKRELIEEIKSLTGVYQLMHGGLSRLKIY